MSLTARTPPVGAISDVEKVACLVVCAVSALCCVAVIVSVQFSSPYAARLRRSGLLTAAF